MVRALSKGRFLALPPQIQKAYEGPAPLAADGPRLKGDGMEKDETDHSSGKDALDARLDQLTKALDAKRQGSEEAARSKSSGSDTGIGKAMGTGFRVASELAAAILVGGLLGWQLDLWVGSTPWFLMIFLILGIVAGFWNVYRLAAKPTGPADGTGK